MSLAILSHRARPRQATSLGKRRVAGGVLGWAVLLPVMLLSLAPTAWAADAPLTGDTFISSTSPTANYGRMAFMNVSATNSALVQFDLSNLPAGLLASQVSKAYLRVYVN